MILITSTDSLIWHLIDEWIPEKWVPILCTNLALGNRSFICKKMPGEIYTELTLEQLCEQYPNIFLELL